MRVLFLTDADYVKSPAARQWFFQMHQLLTERGIQSSLNQFDQSPYDVAIIHWADKEKVRQVIEHSPQARIGILNPGYLGFPKKYVHGPAYQWQLAQQVANNVDFFLVTSFTWRELLLPYHRRVYLIIDYDFPQNKSAKQHTGTTNLVIGYHGNELHYAQDFFPHGANALRRLAREYDFTLKIITSNVQTQPRIEGVKTEFLEFNLDTFANQIQTFDIGLCPAFSTYKQLENPFIYIRNANRVQTLLFYGIPSVASPLPQACQDLSHEETVLFAVSEAGWYDALKRLLTQPDLRNRIGHAGQKLVSTRFSAEAAADIYVNLLEQEIKSPLLPRQGFSPVPLEKQIQFIQTLQHRLTTRLRANLLKLTG